MFNKFFRKKESELKPDEIPVVELKENPDNETYAAIGLAMHLYITEMHDYEKTVLTIQKVMRPYSPWSSKIYGLRKYPRD